LQVFAIFFHILFFDVSIKSRKSLFTVFCLCVQFAIPLESVPAEKNTLQKECVILLHGLARTSASMNKIETKLIDEGYIVINVDYPSRHRKIEELSEIAVAEGLDYCRQESSWRIHFVTHSLGGILIRYYLSLQQIPELGRVVMLAPPNQGSEVVEEFSGYPGYELLNGPAGYQLGKDDKSIPLKLGPADFEVGIIAGDRTINLILSTAFETPNDGKISVEEARLEGMKDFLVVHHSHPFIMKSDEVIDQVLHFLRYGYFQNRLNSE
jgi:triacylglycerol lipase